MWKLLIQSVSLENVVRQWTAEYIPPQTIALYGHPATTLLLMCGGFVTPTEGSIRLCLDRSCRKPRATEIGLYIPTISPLLSYLRIEEYIELWASLYHADLDEVKYMMDEWGLSSSRTSRIIDVDPDTKLRTGIVAALAHYPKILLLETPEQDITENEWSYIWSLLLHVQRYRPFILILSTRLLYVANHCNIQIDVRYRKDY